VSGSRSAARWGVKGIACRISLLALFALAGGAVENRPPNLVYWRFEGGEPGKPAPAVWDESGRFAATAAGKAPVVSGEVPLAVIPATAAANHHSLSFNGGYLREKSQPEVDFAQNFTVELWACFGSPTAAAQVLVSKGEFSSGKGNWHLIYQTDGTVQANIFGSGVACFFDAQSGGPVPGVWYHLAAVYEDGGPGATRIRAYVNGQLRGVALAPVTLNTAGADLFIGAHTDGSVPFLGQLDELRLTPRLLVPREFLIAGAQPIPGAAEVRKPFFVKPGTPIDARLRAKAAGAPILAKPDGYQYFYTRSAAAQSFRCAAPKGFDPGFGSAIQGWNVANGGCPAGYHFAVKPGSRCLVAIGFFDPRPAEPGKRVQRVVMDGREADHALDPATTKPFIRKYEAQDLNGDGFLEVSCSQVNDEGNYTGMMNTIWVFDGLRPEELDDAALLRGEYPVPPLYQVRCGQEEALRGHVDYPELSREKRARLRPMRPILLDVQPEHPQPPDPVDVEIRGELADRIHTYLDRWGYTGRDQKLVAGFLSDSGYEVSGRFLETLYMLGRLMRRDFDLEAPFEALLSRQDQASKFPGAFVGGQPRRTAFIWSQGTVLSGLMGYHEMTGDPRALAAAERLADWYQSYLTNGDLAAANYFADQGKFSRDGATVGQLGKGALEPMVWLYGQTGNPKYLDEAKQMAALNRKWGGVAWMISGDIPNERPELEGWHIHANLTTIRGFPWLYAATGDRTYLEDAIKACDRVFERATWSTGGVLEQVPWGHDVDPHDETCQTSDLLQLCYVLADFTGEARFLDRAELIYYNHIRYMQMHNGDFTAFNRLPGPQRGGDAWFCCGFWGGKALYEVARHVFASSPTAVYVNGYLPAAATLKVGNSPVHVDMEAGIPRSGEVRLTLKPEHRRVFALNCRVPSWAELRQLKVNGKALPPHLANGCLVLERAWKPGDQVLIQFDLPLRITADNSQDGLPAAKASLDGAPLVDARLISVFRGPAIMAQFRLAAGCDLNWAYTGDHPDLFETLNSPVDRIEADDWTYQTRSAPSLTRVDHLPEGVRLEWEVAPHPGWLLKRVALVKPGVPVQVEFKSELIAPSLSAAASIKSVRTCGVRMRTRGFEDYRSARLLVLGKPLAFDDAAETALPHGEAVLDNGYVQFHLSAREGSLAASDEGAFASIYAVPTRRGTSFSASCTLAITGQNQWSAPLIGPGPRR